MLSYILKRLAQTVFVLFGITLITFILLNVVPGDPVAMMLDKRADEATIDADYTITLDATRSTVTFEK